MKKQENVEAWSDAGKPDLPLWAGLWVPFAVVMLVLAKTGVLSIPVAAGTGLASAVAVTVAAKASQRGKAKQ